MGQFAYSFALTLLHSLWQSALLLLLYTAITLVIKKQLPTERRNFLYLLLLVQLVGSTITFYIYYAGAEEIYISLHATDYSNLFTTQPLFQLIAPWMISAYLMIVAYKSFSLVYHWNRCKVNCQENWIKPSIDLRLFSLEKSHQFGIKRKVTLWYSNNITTPITFGFFKPIILLPVALVNQLTLVEAETLIVHELTHIKNNDYLLNFILIICETIFFFNPFIKIIAERIKLEREKNCDLQVLHLKYSSLTYAETLLKAARFKPNNRSFQLAAVSKNKQLLNRILFFTSENNLQFRRSNYSALSYLLILVVFCINLFAITEIKRDRHQTDSAYTSTITPGYNADQLYSFFTDRAATPLAAIDKNFVSPANMNQPVPQNNSSSINPSPEEFEQLEIALEETEDSEEVSYAIPAASLEPAQTKDVLINEESSSSGKSTTKAYKMILIDGQWIAQPMWTLTECIIKKDSIQLMRDSIIRPFHIIQ